MVTIIFIFIFDKETETWENEVTYQYSTST